MPALPPSQCRGGCYLLYCAAKIRMKRRAQTDDRGCNDDECDCEDDRAGWIGVREERYRDDTVDAEVHRLRAAHLAKEAYLDRNMDPPFHNTKMPSTTLDNTTPPPDWHSKSHDHSTGTPHVTPPPPPPPTSAPAVIDGSAAAADIYPSTATNPTTPPTTFAAGAPATPATEPRRRPYTKSAAGVE